MVLLNEMKGNTQMRILSNIPDILFLDTVFIVGLLNRRDPWHETAVSLLPVIEQVPHTVTTEAILTETGNALACLHRSLATSFIRSCYSTKTMDIIPVTPEIFQNGIEVYDQHQDKTWGLTDCISFAVMKNLGITYAMTNDIHFSQAGFIPYMREFQNGSIHSV